MKKLFDPVTDIVKGNAKELNETVKDKTKAMELNGEETI